jgi:REP element-mobilizing transposase RayT
MGLEDIMRDKRRGRPQAVAEGIYYVVRRSRHPGQPIFSDALDYAAFESLLALALARYRCRLHAFCWEPDAIHLVMQVSDRPVGRLLRWLCSWYSRSVSNGAFKRVLFEPTYRATLIESGEALLGLIQYLHLGVVGDGTAIGPADSVLSSHRAYLGIVHIPWLTTAVVLRMLAPGLEQGRLEYRGMMQRLDPISRLPGIRSFPYSSVPR